MSHLTAFAVLILVAAGCTTTTKGVSSPSDVVYDNRGGFSHGGVCITLRPDGTYEMLQYTDVPRDVVVERGVYERQESAYVLNREGVQHVYDLVIVRGVEYLLDRRTFEEYSRTRDRTLLHVAMRRAE